MPSFHFIRLLCGMKLEKNYENFDLKIFFVPASVFNIIMYRYR